MDHMPRLHPEDLHLLGDMVSESLLNTIQPKLTREQILASMITLSVDDVAKLTGKDATTILRHIDKGILKATKRGKEWIITQKSFNNYTDGEK